MGVPCNKRCLCLSTLIDIFENVAIFNPHILQVENKKGSCKNYIDNILTFLNYLFKYPLLTYLQYYDEKLLTFLLPLPNSSC